MAKPDYIICLECEAEVEDFSWRDGEVRRVACFQDDLARRKNFPTQACGQALLFDPAQKAERDDPRQ